MSKKLIIIVIFLALGMFIFIAIFLSAPSFETKKEVSTPLLKIHKVYIIYQNIRRPPVAYIVGEGLDGKTFKLPNEFNEMIVREKINVDTEEKAFEVSETYVNSSITFGRILILKNSSDIPKRNVDENLSEIANIIKPPYYTKEKDKFFVRFYTWKEIGGLVEDWSFNVSRDGRVSVERDEIASRIGAYGMLQ